ncbi:MAG: hypothetical protein HY323_05530 [Betaproteobacteria bacterium]|nr:hypothetical protein [Betaproteobacteria bacterium]
MASPVPLQDRFSLGFKRDYSRDQLPKGALWDCVDYFPDELGAPLRKRGGWEYFGSTLNSLNAGAGVPWRVIYAPFSGGAQVVAMDITLNRVFDLTNSVDRGVAINPGFPVFYRELVVIPPYDGTAAPYKYSGSGAPALLGGSPPTFMCAAVYKDRLAGAGAAAAPNRVYFSAAGNPESWDTTNRYLDTSSPVFAFASLRNALLVFHRGTVERIRGDIPPGSAAANMTLEPLFNEVGLWVRSGSAASNGGALTVSDDYAYWADENGVYQSDGASISDLAEQGGVSTYWRSVVSSAGGSGYVTVAVWRGRVFVSVIDTVAAFVDMLICEIKTRSWFRLTNVRAPSFATLFGSTDELYFANQDSSSKRVGKLSGIYSPTSATKNDANGTAVTPILESGLLSFGSQARKRFKKVYLSYDCRDAATDNPTLTASYLTSPEATSYTALSPTFAETTARTRKRVALPKAAYGVALKVAQTNASSDTRIYALEAEISPSEASRV